MLHLINNHHVFSIRFSTKKSIYAFLIFKQYHRIWFPWPFTRDVWFPHFNMFKSRNLEGGCRDNFLL